MFSITNIIIGITAVVSFMAFSNAKLKDNLIFAPTAVTHRNQWYRFFSCALIHLDITHLVFNMFALYSFGNLVETTFLCLFGAKGTFLYILLYVISQFLCLVPTYNNHKEDYYYQSLGVTVAASVFEFSPPHEFYTVRGEAVASAAVRVAPGPGGHGPERHLEQHWRWSSGRAELRLPRDFAIR